MDHLPDRFVEISGRIASSARFCEFLDAGGRVLDAGGGHEWVDVTHEVLQKERRKMGELESIRSTLFPDIDPRVSGQTTWAH